MAHSLAVAAVRGTQSDIANEKQALLEAGDTAGLIGLNRSLFGDASMMAKKDDADKSEEDESEEDEDDEDEDEDDEDEDDESDDRDNQIQTLREENKKRRKRAARDRQTIADLQAENERLKGKKGKKAEDEEDDESDSEPDDSLKSENKALKERLQKQTIRQEFTDLISNPKAKIKFKDPKVAFRLLDLDEVEVDEDGDVDGLEDAIKALAEEAPYLLVGKADKDEDEDEEKPKRRTGQRTGGSRSKGKPNEDALRKKYGIRR